MENTPKNQSGQSELDLGLNQPEPITPRKESKEDSILSKVGNLFGKKESAQPNQFAVRKEPTFGTPNQETQHTPEPTVATPHKPFAPQNIVGQTVNYSTTNSVFKTPMQTVAQPIPVTTEEKEVIAEPNTSDDNDITPITVVAPVNVEKTAVENLEKNEQPVNEPEVVPVVAEKPNRKNPENWAIMQKLPTKHRRLFIAIAGAVGILLALLWLKPSNPTVEELQSNQGSTTPIEFQSLDPNQPVVSQQADNLVNSQTEVNANTNQTSVTEQESVKPNETVVVAPPAVATQPTMPTANTASVEAEAKAAEQAKAQQQARLAVERAAAERAAAEKAEKVKAEQARAEQARKAEQARLAEKAKAEQQAKAAEQQAKAAAEKARLEQQRKAEQAKAAEKAKTQASKGVPVVEAKPTSNKVTKESTANSSNQASQSTTASSKTLTVPPSTTLFQVFRTNGLDIRDANAMTKAAGAGNVLSSFKANDKIQVSVNSQGRVNSMRLSNGAVFTRQADGTYKYSK